MKAFRLEQHQRHTLPVGGEHQNGRVFINIPQILFYAGKYQLPVQMISLNFCLNLFKGFTVSIDYPVPVFVFR